MSILKRVGFVSLVLALALAVLAGGVYLWALMSTDTSLAARGIIWGDSKVDDWKRFPSRQVHASSERISFEAATPDWMADLEIEGKRLAAYLEETNTTAFIILHGDELLYEGYFNGSSREATQTSFSVAKSFASTLVGIAIGEGYIGSLDDPITAYIPELTDRDRRFDDITIRHLITMSSGIRFIRDDSDPFSDDFVTSHSPNLRAAALDSQIVEAPGQRFHYNDYNPLLIGMILERATGMSVSEYLETRLWQPMGAEGDGSWSLDSERSGFEKMSVGINGRAIDFAKLGWLFLNEGKNGERQVVPAAWVEEATRVDQTTDPAAHYQYYWWVDAEHNAYNAEGNFCQFIYVYPDADLVLVRHGNDCGGPYWTGLLGDIAQWVDERLDQ
jgi:CubicO group peptidase (beta-lactamase class C family)